MMDHLLHAVDVFGMCLGRAVGIVLMRLSRDDGAYAYALLSALLLCSLYCAFQQPCQCDLVLCCELGVETGSKFRLKRIITRTCSSTTTHTLTHNVAQIINSTHSKASEIRR